jgi:hypothetical protein
VKVFVTEPISNWSCSSACQPAKRTVPSASTEAADTLRRYPASRCGARAAANSSSPVGVPVRPRCQGMKVAPATSVAAVRAPARMRRLMTSPP